jgi:hypothetical protein
MGLKERIRGTTMSCQEDSYLEDPYLCGDSSISIQLPYLNRRISIHLIYYHPRTREGNIIEKECVISLISHLISSLPKKEISTKSLLLSKACKPAEQSVMPSKEEVNWDAE